MIRSVTRRLVGTLVGVGLTVCVFAQTPTEGPQLAIVSPESDAFVSGLTMLRASLDLARRHHNESEEGASFGLLAYLEARHGSDAVRQSDP